MYNRDLKPRKAAVIRMDPNCAICHAPASMQCDCEAKGLEQAIKQAEDRVMRSMYTDIRFVMSPVSAYNGTKHGSSWVRAHAQDYILEYFRLLADRRKTAHSANLDRITAHAFHYYNAPPHPSQISDSQAALKRGIDEDWQASVQRYPEVLEYFFGLVELTLPADDEPGVRDPPLSALNGRKANRRIGNGVFGGPTMAPIAYHDEILPSRTPPPGRRTPAPRDRRSGSHRPAVPHPSYYATQY